MERPSLPDSNSIRRGPEDTAVSRQEVLSGQDAVSGQTEQLAPAIQDAGQTSSGAPDSGATENHERLTSIDLGPGQAAESNQAAGPGQAIESGQAAEPGQAQQDNADAKDEDLPAAIDSQMWTTTPWRYGPLAGLTCLLIAFLSIFASLGILASSNRQPTSAWKYYPQVYIAILVAIANQSMRYAAVQGVTIAWWTKAMKGSTLGKLHHDWAMGSALWDSMTAGRATGVIAMACFFSTFVAIDGPLLQRASSVKLVPLSGVSVPLQIALAPELPTGFTGEYVSDGMAGVVMRSNDFDTVAHEFDHGTPMTGVRGCEGTCAAKVLAPALVEHNRTVNNVTVDWYAPIGISNGTYCYQNNATLFYGRPMFEIIVTLLVAEKEFVQVFMALGNACTGEFTQTTILYESAIGLYDVQVTNHTIALISPASQAEIVCGANNTNIAPGLLEAGEINSTLAGVSDFVFDTVYTNYLAAPPSNGGTSLVFYNSNLFVGKHRITSNSDLCTFSDPTDDILDKLNELMFRSGLYAPRILTNDQLSSRLDPGTSWNQTVTGKQTGVHDIFETNYWYFLGAAVLEIVCICAVLPTYWGWWKLGRAVSFSPLEIAKAFEAPLLANCNSNSSGAEMMESVGNVPVRYGATGYTAEHEDGMEYDACKLAFADPSLVYRPLSKFRFRS